MNFKQFTDAVLSAVQEKADGIFTASVYKNEKNNGIVQTGITGRFPDSSISPCLYLEDYYEAYRRGSMTVRKTAHQIYEKMLEGRDRCSGIRTTDLWNWNTMRTYIYPKLINADLNKKQLPNLPHRMFLDLAVVYYLEIMENKERKENGTILIFNEYMQIWGQEEDALYEAAMENMRTVGNAIFRDVFSVLSPECVPDYDEPPMYLLTNPFSCFGAAEILNETTLERIYGQIGDFVLLPSSIFEVIIVPEKLWGNDYGMMAEQVKEINITVLEPEEKLSDHVYVYHGNEKGLQIAE